jgi:glycosyltransferase involved in cell wall biosynthesis
MESNHLYESKENIHRDQKKHLSVLICVKDAFQQVKECIDSIIKYTCESYELILINDNSKDATKSLLEKYCRQYNNIRTITNTTTLGYTKSLNIGLKEVC